MKQTDAELVKLQTRAWIEHVVIGENLCPFARPVLDRISLTVYTGVTQDDFLQAVVQQVFGLLDSKIDERPTSILILSQMGQGFAEYLDLAALATCALEELGVDDEIQIATFHPHYQFDETDEDDPANWTNRSPQPMLHFLRTADVANVISNYQGVEEIPARNMARFRDLGLSAVRQLREKYMT